jgi:hypothetical protein
MVLVCGWPLAFCYGYGWMLWNQLQKTVERRIRLRIVTLLLVSNSTMKAYIFYFNIMEHATFQVIIILCCGSFRYIFYRDSMLFVNKNLSIQLKCNYDEGWCMTNDKYSYNYRVAAINPEFYKYL